MLHLIFQSPIETAVLERTEAGDVLVFLENATLRILQNGTLADSLTGKLATHRLCVLAEDLVIRGISPDALIKGIEVIDYAGLVDLTVKHPLIQSWS